MKVNFKRNKQGKIEVKFGNLTQGEALALAHALSFYGAQSAVCADLRDVLAYNLPKEETDLIAALERNP